MRTKNIAILIVVLLAAILMSACERSASRVPVTTPTSSSEIPFPVATQPQILKDIIAGTQTAAAMLTPQIETTPSVPSIIIETTPVAGIENTPTPTPTLVVVPTATPGRPSSYTLQRGESLYCISRRFDVDPGAVLSANGLSLAQAENLPQGYKLSIPDGPKWSAGSRALHSHPTDYTLQTGDTIYKIACYFGDVSPDMIMLANGLTKAAVTAGQTLHIP